MNSINLSILVKEISNEKVDEGKNFVLAGVLLSQRGVKNEKQSGKISSMVCFYG